LICVNWQIRKGKHVFVEKPLANTMDEARELVKLVKESNIKFQVGHVERFNPAFYRKRRFTQSHVY
jgi:predicted dehydrogenase